MLLNVDYKSYRAPPANGHKCMIHDPCDMNYHGSARSERVRSDIFWSKSESYCSDSNGLSPEDSNDVQGADISEPLSGRIVVDRGGSRAPMFAHREEDVDNRLNRAGYCRLRSEVRNGLPSDCIIITF